MSIDILKIILEYISQYPILSSLLVGIFTGEEVILVLAFLSAQGVLPLWVVFVFVPLGTFICDAFFFFLGRTKFVNRIKEWKHFSKGYEKVDANVGRLTKDRHIFTLFYTKFIYGTRIATLIFLGLKGISYSQFFKYNLIITILWAMIVIPLGYFAGKGYGIILNIFRSVELGLLFILIFIIFFFIIKKWISTKLMKKQSLSI